MSEPVRVLLRLSGVVMLTIGLVCVIVLIVPGPSDVADWMGKQCRHSRNGPGGEQCTITDVLLIAAAAPVLILIGFVLTVALRPPGKGPITLDFSRGRR